ISRPGPTTVWTMTCNCHQARSASQVETKPLPWQLSSWFNMFMRKYSLVSE
ncbi:hypothetical protein LEMLEM_LOCUS23730, partial [Lemmus lemmus]